MLEEWELPAHLARTRYAPTEAECEAIDVSGSNPSTKATVYRMFRINGAMRESGGLTSWVFLRVSQSGGATESPVVTKGTWEKWHLAQI